MLGPSYMLFSFIDNTRPVYRRRVDTHIHLNADRKARKMR